MKIVEIEKYCCWNDCEMTGCPGHAVKLEFYTATNGIILSIGDDQIAFDTNALEAIAKCLAKLVRRVEIRDAIESLTVISELDKRG